MFSIPLLSLLFSELNSAVIHFTLQKVLSNYLEELLSFHCLTFQFSKLLEYSEC